VKSVLDTVERAAFLADNPGSHVDRITFGMSQLIAELMAIASMSTNLMTTLSDGDPNREDMFEINRAACLALAKLEKLGQRAPRLGLV
jgi:hypothetical protein